jgi:hypothetical protein
MMCRISSRMRCPSPPRPTVVSMSRTHSCASPLVRRWASAMVRVRRSCRVKIRRHRSSLQKQYRDAELRGCQASGPMWLGCSGVWSDARCVRGITSVRPMATVGCGAAVRGQMVGISCNEWWLAMPPRQAPLCSNPRAQGHITMPLNCCMQPLPSTNNFWTVEATVPTVAAQWGHI